MTSWFVCQHEFVKGPLTTDEVKAQVADGAIELDCLIWGRGQKDWVAVSAWVNDADKVRETVAKAQVQLWHYAVEGSSKGPMKRSELVQELKNINHKSEILVWTKGMKAWADIFEFHDLLDEIGLNRREHPRAKISGQAVITTEDGQDILGQLKTVSGGGFGVNQVSSLSMGQTVTVELRSNELGEPINGKATVQYVTQSGFAGLRFMNLSMESKSRLLQYIKQLSYEKAA